MKPPISVTIITKNEADRLPVVLAAVAALSDDVVVVDSGSNDGTQDVARAAGARVFHRDWTGYGAQKIHAEGLCRHHWVLNLDADEEPSPEMVRSVVDLFRTGEPPASAYAVAVVPIYPFQDEGHPWTVYQRPLRLYRRDRAGFRDDPVHDSVVVREGGVGRLDGVLIHRSFRSLAHHVEKINDYTTAQAVKWVSEGREPSFFALLLLPLLAFLKQYFLRRQFVNGVDGIVVSHVYAFQRFLRIAKAREAARLARRAERRR